MKTNPLMFLVLLVCTCSWGSASGKRATGNDEKDNRPEFELVKDVAGIRLFTRWIPVTENRSARQIKAVFVMEGTIASVLSVLRNDGSFTHWMNGTRKYYRVKTVDSHHWYSYVQFSVPWPLKNQDCIIKYEVQENPGAGNVMIVMTGTPTYIRPFEGVTRIPHMEGLWIIKKLGHSRVQVEYCMFSNQEPLFPRWITDPIIQNNLLKTMEAFQHEVSRSFTENKMNHVTQ